MSTEEEKNENKDKEEEDNKETKLSNQDNSLNKQMQEIYDQHKNEIQTNQRPQSKYQRDEEQNGEDQKDEENNENQIDEKELINKINEHFNKRQITKKEFTDNQNVFLPLDEFFELFKNIHLDLLADEINYLFNNKNPNKDDGYIYFNTFLDNYNFEFYPGDSTLINKSNTDNIKNESSNSNYTSLLLNKPDKITPAIMNEFTSFKNDILNIVEESKKSQAIKAKLPPIRKESAGRFGPKKSKNAINSNEDKPKSRMDHRRKPQSANKMGERTKTNIPKKKKKINYLQQTLQRQRLEEEMIRLTIDKRDKEFQRDCVKKMVVANEYAEKLGIPNSYSAYTEEGENTIICRVFSKTIKDYKDINLKQFLIEFKKLEKSINQEKEREKYKENKEVKEVTYSSGNKEEDFFKMDRNDKHKIIKKILKESIQLKLQLKKQLKALREIKLMELDTLNKNLKLTNLDDDTIL